MLRSAGLAAILAVTPVVFASPLLGDSARETGNGYLVAEAKDSGQKQQDGKPTAAELAARRDAYRDYLDGLRREHEDRVRVFPECNPELGTPEEWCAWAPPEAGGTQRPPREAVENYVRRVTASLQLPQAYPQVGPDPDWNEWDMAVIGIPLWLWVEGDSHLTASNSDAGLAVSLDATHVSTTFQMGDGTTVTCATTKPYVRHAVAPGTPSPVCGHTYQVAPKSPSAASSSHQQPGTYTVTATTNWSVDWTAGGYSGTLTTQMSGTRDLPVGELQAVVVRG